MAYTLRGFINDDLTYKDEVKEDTFNNFNTTHITTPEYVKDTDILSDTSNNVMNTINKNQVDNNKAKGMSMSEILQTSNKTKNKDTDLISIINNASLNKQNLTSNNLKNLNNNLKKDKEKNKITQLHN